MKINWAKYTELYPDRYIKESIIDSKIIELLKNSNKCRNILDIGGNKGTEVLKQFVEIEDKCYFLDPFMKKPDWYDKQVTWKDLFKLKYKFDIIVAKNSFNYLTENELKIIPKILEKGGIFIANTFIHPREIDREFINSKTNITGREKTIFKKGKIYHSLHIGDNIIEHSFFHYEFEKIIEIFKGEKLSFEITSPSSMLIKIEK